MKRRRVAGRDGPHPIDRHVGTRLRIRRTLLGVSQTALGNMLGLSFQQIQKYERGMNRISAGTLHNLSRILDVPIGFFFDDMPPELVATGHTTPIEAEKSSEPPLAGDVMIRRETLELVGTYYRIGNENLRQQLRHLIKAIACREGPP